MKDISLTEKLSNSISEIITNALKASARNPKEAFFILKYLQKARTAASKRQNFEISGTHIPPFLIASITSKCNLYCKGCYARANNSCGENLANEELPAEKWAEIFDEASKLGISFVLLAGGEPLMKKEVIRQATKHKNIIFPIFTNGVLIDDDYIKLFDKNRNLLPIFSLEGDEQQTDGRRGEGIYQTLLQKLETLRQKGIFFGVSLTVTSENLQSISDTEFTEQLHKLGCKIIFYVEYVPVTPESRELAPTEQDRTKLSDRQKQLENSFSDMIFLSFPGDEEEMGGCLAAGRGFFHINYNGSAEPCPFSPYSDTNINNCTLKEALQSPLFDKLKTEGLLSGEHTGGCLLFEKEQEVKELLNK